MRCSELPHCWALEGGEPPASRPDTTARQAKRLKLDEGWGLLMDSLP